MCCRASVELAWVEWAVEDTPPHHLAIAARYQHGWPFAWRPRTDGRGEISGARHVHYPLTHRDRDDASGSPRVSPGGRRAGSGGKACRTARPRPTTTAPAFERHRGR